MLAAQILVIFLFALFPLLGSGPLWHEFVEGPLGNCAKSWWRNVLFIQNFLGPYDTVSTLHLFALNIKCSMYYKVQLRYHFHYLLC